MNRHTNKRRLRYGSVALIITVLVLVAVVIVNVIASMLAQRYEWMYYDMSAEGIYAISDKCEEYISQYVIPEVDEVNSAIGGEKQKIKIIFCDEKKNIRADESLRYIHDSVYEIKDMFPDHIETDYINVWENPSLARDYGVSSTGDVICEFNGRYETMNFGDFYIFDQEDHETEVAYKGEKLLASCLMRVTQEYTPMCYFTANHGEDISMKQTKIIVCIMAIAYGIMLVVAIALLILYCTLIRKKAGWMVVLFASICVVNLGYLLLLP